MLKQLSLAVFGLGLMTAGAAHADDDAYAVSAANCSGVYGALDGTRVRLAATFPAFAKTNLGEIDYAGRMTKVMGTDDAARAGQLAMETQYKVWLTRDIIDGKMNHVGDILKLSARCDAANGLLPMFTVKQ